MEETKMTVRMPRDLLENAKKYAAAHNTTLTRLIQAYFERIPVQHTLKDAPTVRYLSGLLSAELSEEDYRKHLDEKYG